MPREWLLTVDEMEDAMKKEVARQCKFGMTPSQADYAIALKATQQFKIEEGRK